VFEEKGGGYTVVAEVRPDTDVTSEELWSVAIPGDFRGATKMDRVWHLYYGRDPGYTSGAVVSIDLRLVTARSGLTGRSHRRSRDGEVLSEADPAPQMAEQRQMSRKPFPV
jgi:hypothetical protein